MHQRRVLVRDMFSYNYLFGCGQTCIYGVLIQLLYERQCMDKVINT